MDQQQVTSENEHDSLPDYIPEQQVGKQSDIVTQDSYSSVTEAKRAFRRARAHMLDVNRWNRLAVKAAPARTLAGANPLVPSFSLVNKAKGRAAVGDVIRIAVGKQEMFVKLEAIVEQADEFALQVRTCTPGGDCEDSQHMYAPAATTTFRLSRCDKTVTSGFHGRNEVVNAGVVNQLVDLGMTLGGRLFNWSLLADAWRPHPEAA